MLFRPSLTHNRSTTHSVYWTVECLRSDGCVTPVALSNAECHRFLRCSTCDERLQFACHTDGQCIERTRLCDGRADCRDATDERKCDGVCRLKRRLIIFVLDYISSLELYFCVFLKMLLGD